MSDPVYDHKTQQCLMLIDGLNLVRPVYEVNLKSNAPESEQIDATIKSSLGSFRIVLNEVKPTHVLAAFDYGGETWRHRLYPEYKAKRKPTPQALRDALPYLYDQLVSRLGITVVSIPGVEAEDVIGTCFYRWTAANRGPAVVTSSDKDLSGLMAEGALIRDHSTQEWRNAEWSHRKFGVPPALIHDYLALMGDDTDGVPGVERVGSTTAAKWLLQYGSLEGIIENKDSLKGKVGQSFRDSIEIARLSRQLVALKTDVQCGVTWNTLRLGAGENLATPRIANAA